MHSDLKSIKNPKKIINYKYMHCIIYNIELISKKKNLNTNESPGIGIK